MRIDVRPELGFQTSRSDGPGGQHVNKTETKVEARFDIENSALLDIETKDKLKEKLKGKLSKDGFLIVSASETRSQTRNKELAIEKLHRIIEDALTEKKKRKPTRPSLQSVQKRLKSKKINAARKELRRRDDLF